MSPRRIQQRRTKGWRKPEGAIAVGRGTKWGNPMTMQQYRAVEQELGEARILDAEVRAELTVAFRSLITYGPDSGYWTPGTFQAALTIRAGLDAGELAGKDLMCWCPLDQPCHADVLLELANGDPR